MLTKLETKLMTTPKDDGAKPRDIEAMVAAFDLLSKEDQQRSPDREAIEFYRTLLRNADKPLTKEQRAFNDKMDSGG
jgi:hypothetical protein